MRRRRLSPSSCTSRWTLVPSPLTPPHKADKCAWRRLLGIEPIFAGRKAYYFELLRMLPPALVPKLAPAEEAAEE